MEVDRATKKGKDPFAMDLAQCAGALVHANKSCKSYRNPFLSKLQRGMDPKLKDEVLGYTDFLEHHTEMYKFYALEKDDETKDHLHGRKRLQKRKTGLRSSDSAKP